VYFQKKYCETGTTTDRKGTRSPRIFQEVHLRSVDETMAADNELTSTQLHSKCKERFPDVKVSLSTIKKTRSQELGWLAKWTHYCALIIEQN